MVSCEGATLACIIGIQTGISGAAYATVEMDRKGYPSFRSTQLIEIYYILHKVVP